MSTVHDVVRAALQGRGLMATLPAHTLNSNPRLPQYLTDARVPGTRLVGSGSRANPYRLVIDDVDAARSWLNDQDTALQALAA